MLFRKNLKKRNNWLILEMFYVKANKGTHLKNPVNLLHLFDLEILKLFKRINI